MMIYSQHMRHPLTILFHLSSLLQMPNDHKMIDDEFFGNLSRSFKRISIDGSLSWSLSTSDGQPLCSSSSRLSSPLQNFLNHHCTFISSCWVKCVADVVSCLHCSMTHFEHKFKKLKFTFCLTSFL